MRSSSVTWYGPVIGFCGTLANYDFRRHETFTGLIDTRPRHQQRPSAGEAGAVAELMPSPSLVPSNATLVLLSVVTSPPAASSGAGRLLPLSLINAAYVNLAFV